MDARAARQARDRRARRRAGIAVVVAASGAALLAGCSGGAAGLNGTERWSSRPAPADDAVASGVLGRPEADAAAPIVTLPPVDPGADLRLAAIDELARAVDANDPLLRANAIEALHAAPDYLDEAVQRGLVDPNRGVRFVAAMTVGTERLVHLSHLVEPLLRDPSESVRAAAIFALHVNGHAVELDPLATMLRERNPEVKANAAVILGELGNRSAVPMLRAALGRDLELVDPARARLVDMQIAEALVRLGETEHAEGIRAALFAPPEQAEATALACQMAARLHDGRVTSHLLDLAIREGARRPSPEVRLAAAAAVAEIDPARAPQWVALELAGHERAAVRAQAAMTLGAFGGAADRAAIARLLGDARPEVRVAAAAAALRATE